MSDNEINVDDQKITGLYAQKLAKAYRAKNKYHELSQERDLTITEIQYTMNNMYNAKMWVQNYKKNMKLNNDDDFSAKESEWIRNEMRNIMQNIIGSKYEIKKTNQYVSHNGDVIKGNTVSINQTKFDRIHHMTFLYNWMEIDEWFWLTDHRKVLENYEVKMKNIKEKKTMLNAPYCSC